MKGTPAQLEVFLRKAFSIVKDQKGIESINLEGGVYEHVVLELAAFNLGDYEIKRLFEAKEETGFSFYIKSIGEANHTVVFYNS